MTFVLKTIFAENKSENKEMKMYPLLRPRQRSKWLVITKNHVCHFSISKK